MKIPFSYVFRNLWTRRLTTMLTMAGVGLVVFAYTAVLMLSNGLNKTLVSTGTDENVIVIRKTAQTEMISALSRESASLVTTLPEIAVASDSKPLASAEVSVIVNLLKIGSNDLGNVIVRGVGEKGLSLRPSIQFVHGGMFKFGSSEIVVGNSIHTRFQGCEVGQTLRFCGRDWRIVGVFESNGSGFESEIWGDVDQMMPAFGRPVYSAMTARLKSPSDFNALKARFDSDPRLQQLEVKGERQFFSEQSSMMATFINVMGIAITIIFSFGAMIGAMITMYAAVSNRTREIGTLRALGFRRRSVLTAFLFEAILISVIGGAIGLVIASFLNFITISTTNWGSFAELAFSFALSPGIVINSMIFAVIMGIVGGFLPAARASRLAIVNALRAE